MLRTKSDQEDAKWPPMGKAIILNYSDCEYKRDCCLAKPEGKDGKIGDRWIECNPGAGRCFPIPEDDRRAPAPLAGGCLLKPGFFWLEWV